MVLPPDSQKAGILPGEEGEEETENDKVGSEIAACKVMNPVYPFLDPEEKNFSGSFGDSWLFCRNCQNENLTHFLKYDYLKVPMEAFT